MFRFAGSLLLVWCLCTFSARAAFDFNPRMQEACRMIIRMRFDNADKLLSQEKSVAPQNHVRILLESYRDFLKTFVEERRDLFAVFRDRLDKRLRELESVPANRNSPFYLYTKSELSLQQSLLHIKFQENVAAAMDLRKSWQLLEENKKIYPSFPLNLKIGGFLHAMIGAIPHQYEWLVQLSGMQGSLTQGTLELKRFVLSSEGTAYACYQEEALYCLGNIQNSLTTEMTPDPWMMEQLRLHQNVNPLLRYSLASILMKDGFNDQALSLLSVPPVSGEHALPFAIYRRGLCKLRQLDTTAIRDLTVFLRDFHGDNYIKAAWQKIAWVHLLNGNMSLYQKAMDACLKMPSLIIDEDKEAQMEAEFKEIPNPHLLRARLLFDGGYYKESLRAISGMSVDSFPGYRNKLELTYRFGRIYKELGQTDKAINCLESTIKNGSSARWYYAANSALILASYYEERKEYQKAESYYRRCLGMRNHDYQNSIDQKAKAGLDRISSATRKGR